MVEKHLRLVGSNIVHT